MSCLDDATVLSLVEGRLPPAVLASVDEHIDACASCRDVVTLVAGSRGSSRVLARGDTVGRYVIGDLLGTGAMGRVYSAWEPELDRRVAIKVLIDDASGARERLVREAQAMAKLNHPNVVTVHEVGTTDAGVYVAMELVEGETLRSWVETPRPWREVIRILIEVARGLAAVHVTGVVHRDVKPDNTIVGSDGRVRLGDFGLARSGAKTDEAAPLAVGTSTTVAGTPVYMAPEVLGGAAATPASDQFSFGVMAFELLAGRRPFAGTTWAELLDAMESGKRATAITTAPTSVVAVIDRCLARDAADRHPSLQTVADALDRLVAPPTRSRWIAPAVLTAALASIVTGVVVRSRSATTDDVCAPPPSPWAMHHEQEYAFLGAPTLELAKTWVTQWQGERVETCRAAKAGGIAQAAARERCLDSRVHELFALLHAVDRSNASRALDAFAALPPPSDCRTATEADPLPLAHEQATAATEVATALPALRARIALGEGASAEQRAHAFVVRARASHHAPTLADALLVHAEALRGVDRLADAAAAARDASAAATKGRADLLAAQAWITRVQIAGETRDLTAADDLGVLATAAVERVGSPAHLTATLLRLRGLIAYNRGHLDDARTLLLDAHARFITLAGTQSLEVALVESALGSVERQAGNLREAERWHRSAYAIDKALRGDSHKDIARDLHNIAGVLRLDGRLDDALALYQNALAIEIATQGERSIAAGLTRNSIGLVLMAQEQYDAARTSVETALSILTAAGHGDRAFAEHNLGLIAQQTGKHADAIAHFDRAAAIYKTTIGADAEPAKRLSADRARSARATVVRPPPRAPGDAEKAHQQAIDQAAKTGVYGSGQGW